MAQPVPQDLEPPGRADPGLERTREVLDLAFGPPRERAFDIHLWDGSVERGGLTPHADYALHIRRRGALRRMLARPSELSIAEAFISGDIDVSGNLESVMTIGDQVGARIRSLRGATALMPRVLALPKDDNPDVKASRYARLTSGAGAKRKSTASEIEHHYGVGNEFYSLWLDPRMQYSCGYFQDAATSLADAQTAKLDLICRKLRLKAGERLLDVGCGWSGLIQYAVEHYGVTALGITLSASQAEWGERAIAAKGLSDRCRVEVRDLRDLSTADPFDKITSVGVMEHVAEAEQPAYFERIHSLLRPGGLFMNQTEVSINAARSRNTVGERFNDWLWKRDQFIDRYVFPDGKLVALGSVVTSAERSGFETRDIESLREHYTLTLRAWLRGLLRHKAEAIALVGERTFRIWHLYMSAAAHGFDSGSINLVQMLLAKPAEGGRSSVPLTRADLYDAGLSP